MFCVFLGLISIYSKFIIFFVEDEVGELYFLVIFYLSVYVLCGFIYKFVDFFKVSFLGKCKYKLVFVRIKSKWILFRLFVKIVLDLLKE